MTGLQINNLSLTIDGFAILQDISVSLKQGEMVGLIGPNGAGKSSLLKSILGLVNYQAGNVTLDGQELSDMPPKARAKMLAYTAQGAPVHWPLTVERIVALGRIPHLSPWQKMRPQDETAVQNALAATDCEHLQGRLVTTLSGGERARVLLARTLATGAACIFADEPVASLDPFHQLQVMDILKKHTVAQGAVLVVLHDLGLAARYCDRLILLHEGRLIDQDRPEHILSDENIAHVFGVAASRWREGDQQFLATQALSPNLSIQKK